MLDLAPDLTQAAGWMPIVFLVVMGLAMLAYVILDGYDLGVGVLMRRASDDDKDTMVASIGPFWDANEPGWCWVWVFCSRCFTRVTASSWARCMCRWPDADRPDAARCGL